MYAVAKFIVHDWGDKVDSGIGGFRTGPAMLHRLAGWYIKPMPESPKSLIQGLGIWLQVLSMHISLLYGTAR